MKKTTLILLFLSCIGNAQFFEEAHTPPEEEQSQDHGFSQDAPVYDEPDQGVDGPGQPGEFVPIDDWLFLLPIIGIGLGAYFLRNKRKWA